MDYNLEEELVSKAFYKLKALFFPFEDNNYCPKFLQSKFSFYFIICLLILKIAVVGVSFNFPKNIFFADVTKNALVEYINQGRKQAGVGVLTENVKLDQAAFLKAQDMMAKGYFYHVSPDGVTPWYWFGVSGYDYKYAGENLAIGFFESDEVYNAWLNSQSHKDNILNPNYKEVGTAVLKGNFNGSNTTVVVQLFGSPAVTPTTANTTVKNTPVVTNTETPVQPAETAEIINDTEPENNSTTASKVLSETSERLIFKGIKEEGENNFYLRILNYIFYSSDEIIQTIVYALLILTGISMFLMAFSEMNKQSSGLVFKSMLFMVLLSAAAVINRETITGIIPHRIII